MDGIGIGQVGRDRAAQLPVGANPKPAPQAKANGQSFQIEAASLEISVKLNYVQLTGGDAPAATVQDLLAKVRDWVRDIFEAHGLEFKELSPEEAQAKIADGGDQAPEAVAQRIIDFVKGFANGSPERAQLLRDAVEKGFGEAEAAWGSKLPEISYRTMDLVRTGLDDLFGAKPEQPQPATGPKVDLAA
jgi:hypothetical protein